MNKVLLVLLFIVGLINFLPVAGVLSAAKLSQAYSIELASNDLIILLRHRALLFGLVGGFVFYSMFMPQFQPAAMSIAAISMIGYLVIMWSVGDYNDSIFKVAIVDMIGIAALGLAVLLKYVFMRG
jgi:hypothetical protein